MAQLSELSLFYQAFMKAYRYRKSRWTRPAPVPPLEQAHVAIVTTAGLHLPAQPRFDETVKGGDSSYRWIPNTVSVQDLRISHRSQVFDHSGIEADRNLGFPLDRFRELEQQDVIGKLNHRHVSFMGSITAPGKLTTQTAPEVAAALRADGVNVAFLVPV